jgi:RNase H-fold protein (predicted Holliday junction resolvase)
MKEDFSELVQYLDGKFDQLLAINSKLNEDGHQEHEPCKSIINNLIKKINIYIEIADAHLKTMRALNRKAY